MRWSLTPPFHLFFRFLRRMYFFCDTIRFGRILPAEPSLSLLTQARKALYTMVFGLSSPSCFNKMERLPDSPTSASGFYIQSSQQTFIECAERYRSFYSINGFFKSIPRFANSSASRFCSRSICFIVN